FLSEQGIEFSKEEIETAKKREGVAETEKIITEQLKREIEAMEMDESLKGEAKKKADKIEFLGEKEKIKHLLGIAEEKGVLFAVGVAKDMKDPYLLDIFHDILAQEGYYKKFMK
ncbi:MAG: hypothetical protein Q8O66_00695, partial [bacterium]|nr:hypothetical protein [bacterium]